MLVGPDFAMGQVGSGPAAVAHERGRGGGAREVLGGAGAGHGGGVVQGGAVGGGDDARMLTIQVPPPSMVPAAQVTRLTFWVQLPRVLVRTSWGGTPMPPTPFTWSENTTLVALEPPPFHHGDGVGELAARGYGIRAVVVGDGEGADRIRLHPAGHGQEGQHACRRCGPETPRTAPGNPRGPIATDSLDAIVASLSRQNRA